MGTRKLVVEVVGDSRQLERSFARSSKATQQFGNDITGTAAKVDQSFTKMQRLATGAFVGGAAFRRRSRSRLRSSGHVRFGH
jgi:hypothetical protein